MLFQRSEDIVDRFSGSAAEFCHALFPRPSDGLESKAKYKRISISQTEEAGSMEALYKCMLAKILSEKVLSF